MRVTPALLVKQLMERRQTSHWLGEVEFDGRAHDVITLVMEVGPALALYIDQDTHMLTRMECVLPPFGQVEYRFLDYTMIDGIAFNLAGPVLNWSSLLIAIVVTFIAVLILRRLVFSMRTAGRTALITPVVIYAFFLGLTLWSATTTLLRPEWPRVAGWLAAVGGALFFTSDAAIAWNRFVGPHRGGRIFEMISYHLAQLALSAGVLVAITASV